MEELEPVERLKKLESPYLIPLAVVIAGLIIGAAIYFRAPSSPKNIISTPTPDQDKGVKTATIDIDDTGRILGNPAAEVAVVEFSDFQCPFCGRFFQTTLPDLKEKYIKTGKVKFIYRDFPLSGIHANAQKAAEAALCAGDQDKFWPMHDKIFENQSDLSVNNLKKLAADLGLAGDFASCLDLNKYEEKVKKDFEIGTAAGIDGTPTFFIGRLPIKVKYKIGLSGRTEYIYDSETQGQVLVGALPLSEFEKAIGEELNR